MMLNKKGRTTIAAVALALSAPASAQEFGPEMAAARTFVLRAREQAACPTDESLSRPWIEHKGPVPNPIYERHLKAALDGAAPALLPVDGVSWWIGASRRGRGGDASAHGCLVRGSAALYANGPEDAPAADFVKVVGSGAEATLRASLIELRWYDAADGRKYRWFNTALAARLGWNVDGRGAPTGDPRPIPLPDAINELL